MGAQIIPLATGQRFEWSPPWLAGDPAAPVFVFRGGSLADRADFEGRLTAAGAGEIWPFEAVAAFNEGLARLLADQPDDVARLSELFQQRQFGQDLSSEDAATLDQAERIIAEHWPAMREIAHRAAKRQELMPAFAFQRYCCGWDRVVDHEGEAIAFAQDALGRIPDALLIRLDPLHLRAGGLFAYGLQYGRSAEKNSAPPSISAAPRRPSKAGSKARGSAAKPSGPKTPD